ncbi:hypothetical protein B0I00_1866 [Novosphingobium kunmingense]|uniref:Uncharacterized protein n=1 Tax=Novosphingobium kunmingense TaxID=1211806 RepID=A0A2N0HKY3_9SPHN|nr:hypothetical protein [Novosphingobium kunmingense]PKB19627.1 hypothetical protein B0I00_1866 [Novosphingobium kunmingense]
MLDRLRTFLPRITVDQMAMVTAVFFASAIAAVALAWAFHLFNRRRARRVAGAADADHRAAAPTCSREGRS